MYSENNETYYVKLWLTSHEETYYYYREKGYEFLCNDEKNAIYDLANLIQEDLERCMLEEVDGLYLDLLHHALSNVNYRKVAQSFLD